ncbi:MAG: hypothetical protein ACK4HV_03130 [Parachlamydiaceae bacterium]
MSFYDPPKVDSNIKGSLAKGFSLNLPNYCFRQNFLKLGIRFNSIDKNERYAYAKLPKRWSYVLKEGKEGFTVLLLNENAIPKAKILYGLFIDVDFL